MAWYWKVLAVLVALLLCLAYSVALFEAGKRLSHGTDGRSINEALVLGARVVALDAEVVRLQNQASAAESDLQIERATAKQLSRQVKSLEMDNTLLKEDLAFFEGLMPSAGTDDGVRIEHLRIEPEASSGEYRYRMLIVNSGQGQKKTFKGGLQFLVKVERRGSESVLTIPNERNSNRNLPQYSFESRYFRRLEGSFKIPSEAIVLGVEARVLQDGEVRAKQYVIL